MATPEQIAATQARIVEIQNDLGVNTPEANLTIAREAEAAFGANAADVLSQATGVSAADIGSMASAAGYNFNAGPPSIFETGTQAITDAISGVGGLTSFTPSTVTAGTVTAPTLPDVDISQYYNPYETQVVNTALEDLERQRQVQAQADAARASAAGAFGGSRAGVAQALTNEAFARQGGQLAANLRQQGFAGAQQLAQQDLNRQMQGMLANQQQTLRADLANQTAGLQGAQFQLGANQALAGLGQTAYGLGTGLENQLMADATAAQNLQQQLYGLEQGQFENYFGTPLQTLNLVGSILGQAPGVQTQTTGVDRGLFDYLTLLAYSAPTLRGMFPSDERLKDDIEEVKTLPNGIKVVRWKWNDIGKKLANPDQPTYGVVAQQIADIIPEAVKKHVSGYLMVDYSHPELRGV